MKLKRLFLGSLLFAFLMVQILGAFVTLAPAKTYALPANEVNIDLRFTSAARIVATITYNGVDTEIIFRDGNPMDKTMRYEAQGNNSCPGSLTILESDAMRSDSDYNKEPRIITANSQGSNPRATTDIDFRPEANSTCQEIGGSGDDVEVDVRNRDLGKNLYAYTSPDQITRVWDGGDYTFTRSPDNPTIFIRNADQNSSECRDFIKVLGDGSNYQLYDIRGGSSTRTPGPDMPIGCRYNTDNVTGASSYNFGADGYSEADRHEFAIRPHPLGGLQNIDDDPTNDSAPPGTGSGENTAPSCESSGGPLAWIFCPVLAFIDDQLTNLDGVINNLLQQPPSNLEDGGALNNAWKVMRNMAYLILVPIMLVMVIGTALGFEFVSAYTIKRALPRLIAATLFIALSWELCVFMVTLINDVGAGVNGLITSPFGSIPTSLAEVLGGGGGALLFTGIIGAGGAGILVLGPALIGILLSYAFVALMAILIGVFVLTIRQVLILFLVLIAPLAILAWIFPGNDKLWKLWWGSFSKLLLMYPLIMGLIAIGRVFAGVTSTGESFDGLLEFSVKLIAYIAPYFFIPATFKFAGGIFATVAGMANDRSRGLFDRQKKSRAETAGSAYRDWKTGAVQDGLRGSVSRGVGRRVGVGWKGRYGLGGKARTQAAFDKLGRDASINSVMKGEDWNAVNQNDDALHAATYSSAAAAQAALTARFNGDSERAARAVAAVQTSIGFGQPQAIAAAQQLVSTGTGYDDMPDMVATLRRASGGNAGTASALAGFANAETKKVGRSDLAPSFGLLDKAVRGAPDAPSHEKMMEEAWKSGSLYTHANGKPKSLENLIGHLDTKHAAAVASGNYAEQVEAETARLELQEMLKNSTGGNAELINAGLQAMDGRTAAAPLDPSVTNEARKHARVFDTRAAGAGYEGRLENN